MKKYATVVFTLLTLATVFSCKKDDHTPVIVDENPLTDYLDKAGFKPTDTVVNSEYYEFGISFKPTASGSITDVVVKLPDNHPDLRVTIWDASTKEIIKTETIATVTAHVEVKKSITPIQLTKGKEYMITFNSDDWYDHAREDEGDASYPITVGGISITGYSYASGDTQTYPDSPQTDYYAGDLGFIFHYTK